MVLDGTVAPRAQLASCGRASCGQSASFFMRQVGLLAGKCGVGSHVGVAMVDGLGWRVFQGLQGAIELGFGG